MEIFNWFIKSYGQCAMTIFVGQPLSSVGNIFVILWSLKHASIYSACVMEMEVAGLHISHVVIATRWILKCLIRLPSSKLHLSQVHRNQPRLSWVYHKILPYNWFCLSQPCLQQLYHGRLHLNKLHLSHLYLTRLPCGRPLISISQLCFS